MTLKIKIANRRVSFQEPMKIERPWGTPSSLCKKVLPWNNDYQCELELLSHLFMESWETVKESTRRKYE